MRAGAANSHRSRLPIVPLAASASRAPTASLTRSAIAPLARKPHKGNGACGNDGQEQGLAPAGPAAIGPSLSAHMASESAW